jgi:hypothetical protein
LARYYELKTNKPLYMTIDYQLTYSDADVPPHYGWKVVSRLEAIERDYMAAAGGDRGQQTGDRKTPSPDEVRKIISALDDQGRWVSTFAEGQRLVGQPKFKPGFLFLDSGVFSKNLETLSDFVSAAR